MYVYTWGHAGDMVQSPLPQSEQIITVHERFSLHTFRNHDIRMTLNYYEVMTAGSPEYEVVEKLVRTVSLSDPEKRTISLETRTDDWNVNFIRHKTREAYRIDDKYIVTVAAIRESRFNEQLSNTYVSVTPDLYHKTHTEIEVKNGVSTTHALVAYLIENRSISLSCPCPLSLVTLCTSLHILVSQPHLGVCFWSGCRFLS